MLVIMGCSIYLVIDIAFYGMVNLPAGDFSFSFPPDQMLQVEIEDDDMPLVPVP